MADFWVGTEQGEIGLEEWAGLMARFPQYSKRAITSAMKSEGSRMQKRIKALIMAGGRELDPAWQQLNPHTKTLNKMRGKDGLSRSVQNYKKSRKGVKKGEAAKRIYWNHRDPGSRNPLSRFAGATRYAYFDEGESGQVLVGFMRHNMIAEARKQAAGYKTPVTPRMRKMAFAMGFPLNKATTELITPPRPIIGPVFLQEKETILRNVKEKTMRNIYRYCTGKSKDQVEKDWQI